MADSLTTILLSIAGGFASLAMVICIASLAVISPWWRRHRRASRYQSNVGKAYSSTDVLFHAVEALAVISPSSFHSARSRDQSHRCSVFAESQSIPLRFQPEKFYGSTKSPRSSISSVHSSYGAGIHRNSMVASLASGRPQISIKDGFLAPPTSLPRSGSTSMLHEMVRGGFEVSPVPAFLSTVKPQPKNQNVADWLSESVEQKKIHTGSSPTESTIENSEHAKMANRHLRRTTLGVLTTASLKPATSKLGNSLSELATIISTQVSKSTNNSPRRRRSVDLLLSKRTPIFSVAEAPGGILTSRVFIDATGKQNLTVRVHLFSADNIPTERPWKNSNYVVRAALIGFKSHFIQTTGIVTAACGSPRFVEGNPYVLDFVMDCGKPFNQSEEDVTLTLTIVEFTGRKLGEKSTIVCHKDYKFNHQTLKGKSTLTTDIKWEPCEPTCNVYQMSADVLTTLTQREADGTLRFEMHEIRNLAYKRVTEEKHGDHNSVTDRHNQLYPVKLRLRACLVSNGKAIRVRKGFNIRLPQEFADSANHDLLKSVSDSSSSPPIQSNSLILKEAVSTASERTITFTIPFQRSISTLCSYEEECLRAGVNPINWRIVAYFVLILESPHSFNMEPKRVRAIGRCCLGNSAGDADSQLLFNIATSSAERQVSQWVHVD